MLPRYGKLLRVAKNRHRRFNKKPGSKAGFNFLFQIFLTGQFVFLP